MEGIGLAVLGDLPAMRQIRDDRLAAVARVMPDQIVEHACHGTEIEECAGLMQIEMWGTVWNAHAQNAAPLGVRLGRGKLEFRTVEFERNVGRMTHAPAHSIGAGGQGSAAFQEITAVPPRTNGHEASPLWLFSGL